MIGRRKTGNSATLQFNNEQKNIALATVISGIIIAMLLLFAIRVGDWIHVPFMAPLFIIILLFSHAKKTLSKEFYILFPLIVLLATLGSKHTFDYYRSVEWYDSLVHFIVTFVFTYFFAFLARLSAWGKKTEPLFFAAFVVGLGIALGVFWEIFEWGLSRIIEIEMYEGIDDLITDLVMDTIGAVLAGIFIFKSALQKRLV